LSFFFLLKKCKPRNKAEWYFPEVRLLFALLVGLWWKHACPVTEKCSGYLYYKSHMTASTMHAFFLKTLALKTMVEIGPLGMM